MNEKPTFEEFAQLMAEKMNIKITPVQIAILKHIDEGKRLYVNLPLHILRKG